MNQATSILGAIYRRKHVVLLVMAGAIGVGLYQSSVHPPDFVAVAEIMIPAQAIKLSISTEEGNIPTEPLLPMQDEGRLIGVTSLLRSRAVVQRVAEALPGSDARRLKSNIRGDVSKEGIVTYTGYGATAEEASRIANASVIAFAEILERTAGEGMRSNLASFLKNEPIAKERARAASEAISDYLISLKTADLSADVQRWLSERAAVQREIFNLDGRSLQNQAQRPIIERTLSERPEFVLSRSEMKLPGGYSNSLEHVATLASSLATARLKYKTQHPEIIRLQTELEMARAQAAKNADLILSSTTMMQDRQIASLSQKLIEMDIFVAGYEPQRAIYVTREAELDAKLEGVPGYRQHLSDLQAEYSQARGMAESIATRREELEFHLEHGLAFSVIDPFAQASPEQAKQIPTTTGILMFTSFAGLLFGIFIALVTATFSRMRATRPY